MGYPHEHHVKCKPWLQLKLELYFCKSRTTKRVGEYLNPNFAGYLNFKRGEPKPELHISKIQNSEKKKKEKKRSLSAKTKGLPSP